MYILTTVGSTVPKAYIFSRYARNVVPAITYNTPCQSERLKLDQSISNTSFTPKGTAKIAPNMKTQEMTVMGLYLAINGLTTTK